MPSEPVNYDHIYRYQDKPIIKLLQDFHNDAALWLEQMKSEVCQLKMILA